MAAVTLEGLMDGIASRLGAISGLNVNADLTEDNLPVALVSLPGIPNYHGAFAHGRFMVDAWPVLLFVRKDIDQVGIRTLAGFADLSGSTSIHAAIEADRTLGISGVDCIVVGFRPLDAGEVNRYGFVGGEFTLKVIAQGS
jgi:hypothetical protein